MDFMISLFCAILSWDLTLRVCKIGFTSFFSSFLLPWHHLQHHCELYWFGEPGICQWLMSREQEGETQEDQTLAFEHFFISKNHTILAERAIKTPRVWQPGMGFQPSWIESWLALATFNCCWKNEVFTWFPNIS